MHTAVRFPTRIGALALLDGGYWDVHDDPDYDPSLDLEARTAELHGRAEQGESWDASPEVIAVVMQGRGPGALLSSAAGAEFERNSGSARAGHGTTRVRVDQGPRCRSLRAGLPGAEVIALPGAGHHLLGEAAPDVERILLDWLRRRA